MRYQVLLSEGAERDLEEIYDYIEKFDSAKSADYLLHKLIEAAERLASFRSAGPIHRKLLALGIREYRQTYFKPYRLVYRVLGRQVIIYLIADGRRDMQSLLSRRLLGA
jgi:toxin ParE1/3/4